jgi:signal transduction histidine kinase
MEPEKTETSVAELKRLNEQLEGYGKLLIRRDLELNRANESLRALDRVKSEFVSRVTHQLRTPLSGMKWALWMLISGEVGPIDDEQRVFLMKIYESNERMIRLINDVAEVDRIESGTVPLRIEQTQIVNLLENVLTEMEFIARKQDIMLDFLPHGDIPLIPKTPLNTRDRVSE